MELCCIGSDAAAHIRGVNAGLRFDQMYQFVDANQFSTALECDRSQHRIVKEIKNATGLN
jgi:hypothetical protein